MPRAKAVKRSKRRPAAAMKRIGYNPQSASIAAMERGLKTRVISLLMLIIASSIGFWFFGFAPWALVGWILIVMLGGYIVFESDLSVSKALVVLSAIVMQFLVLNGSKNLLVLGSPTNLLMDAFVVLDVILLYALSKL